MSAKGRKRTYETDYTLGRLTDGGTTWTEIEPDRAPPWSRSFRYRSGLTTAPSDAKGRR